MRILVVGAGSTGGYFGGRMAAAGRDVTFLVRPARAEQLAARGLEIVSPHGDVTLQPKLVQAGEIPGPFDLVFLTVKAFALEPALQDVSPAVGPDTMVFPILNGMRHLDILRSRFGSSVIGGVCKVATTLDPEGRIRQLAPFQELSYGEISGGSSDRIAALDAVMQGCGFTARASTNILQEMWDKWVMLATMGALTCLMRGTIGEIEAVPGGAAMASAMLAESAAVASASGHPCSEAYLAQIGKTLTTPGSPQASSMYRDLQAGNPVEADQIVGDLLARARGFGQPTPLLAAAYVSLSVYDRRRAAG
ncbi:2-dehydropantoate 2-reductase [uncultured Enterovirga sp.]|uniref:2-dehydropantoate 2-reductase n=1 Tax=uncultured Enterovirga sp. TaxID=2026352 RepID=UPI0035CA8EC4